MPRRWIIVCRERTAEGYPETIAHVPGATWWGGCSDGDGRGPIRAAFDPNGKQSYIGSIHAEYILSEPE